MVDLSLMNCSTIQLEAVDFRFAQLHNNPQNHLSFSQPLNQKPLSSDSTSCLHENQKVFCSLAELRLPAVYTGADQRSGLELWHGVLGQSVYFQNSFAELWNGGADDYLQLRAGAELQGIRLARLFVLYALYRSDPFFRVNSISGFLWFPEIEECIFSMNRGVDRSAYIFLRETSRARPKIRL